MSERERLVETLLAEVTRLTAERDSVLALLGRLYTASNSDDWDYDWYSGTVDGLLNEVRAALGEVALGEEATDGQ
ncbi:MAG: hypothetical protein M0R22_07580 [Dehalococcoidia bacterium]|nr:hypothetical protein [Dehalococcoidia bacterium]